MSKWTTYSYDLLSQIPKLPGVYAIYKDGLLRYIGQAADLRYRITGHTHLPARKGMFITKRKFKGQSQDPHPEYFVKIRTSFRDGEWLMAEYRLIKRLKPPLNIQHTRRAPYNTLVTNVFKSETKLQAYNSSVEIVDVAKQKTREGLTRIELARYLNKLGHRDYIGRLWNERSVDKLVSNSGIFTDESTT